MYYLGRIDPLRILCNPKFGFSLASIIISIIVSFFSLMDEVVHTSPTIGSNVEEIHCKKSHFIMWDIGGQETLRSSWSTYYSNSDVSLFLFF